MKKLFLWTFILTLFCTWVIGVSLAGASKTPNDVANVAKLKVKQSSTGALYKGISQPRTAPVRDPNTPVILTPAFLQDLGACCHSGGCDDLLQSECIALEGYWRPDDECASYTCLDVVVYLEDFDSGMGIWAGEWGLATNNYHSPPNSLADSPVGNYADYDTVVVETTEDIDLVGYAGYRLEFWTKYDIEAGFDYIYLDISSDGGSNWNNLYVFNGEGIDWYNFIADLGGYAERGIRFRFTLETDALYNVDGMYVDDFTIFGLVTDTSPPLILHDGPTPATSVPEEFTVLATITDYSGVQTAWVSYAVDGSDMEIAEIDSTIGDDYYFTIPAVEAGAHVEYFITAVDNEDNEGSTATEHYVSGTVIYYDDGEPEYIYDYGPGDKLAVRFTPEENCILVTGLMRLYTDNLPPPHPLDTVDVEVWENGTGDLPGQSALEPFGVWPDATLEDPQAWTYVDFRGMGLELDDDFHFGFTYRSEFPVILGEDPRVAFRSSVYSSGSWTMATTDFEMRVVVDLQVVLPCEYIPGDCDHNGTPLALADVIAMIGMYSGDVPPPYECDCPPHGANFTPTADPNGNCVAYEISDVVWEIAAYRVEVTAYGCVDCPGDGPPPPGTLVVPSLKSKVKISTRGSAD